MKFDWQGYLADYDFSLPEELIARRPEQKRDGSRLLVVDKSTGRKQDLVFSDLPSRLDSGHLLVFNTTRVSARRVALRRPTGGRISSLFLHSEENGHWTCLIKGAGKLKSGEILQPEAEGSAMRFRYHGHREQAEEPANSKHRQLEPIPKWNSLDAAERFFEKYGEPPLPPYLKREADQDDFNRYQTVYARRPGSVAGPTAGFHFTESLIEKCLNKGVRKIEVDLQIGYGTFAPLKERNFLEKKLHTETYRIEQAELLNDSKEKSRIAVGTTTLRALEDNFRTNQGKFSAEPRETSLFVYPPDRIQSIQGLITNFHLPRSSLFLLVCAFGGREPILEAYRHAIKEGYRFYSYGDSMLII